jgi:hypothetical protein
VPSDRQIGKVAWVVLLIARKKMVGATGFEPVTTRTPSVCATRLRYAPTMSLK